MPSSLHEVLVELFRQRPLLAPELLANSLEVELPGFEQARVESGELTDLAPTEYRADAWCATPIELGHPGTRLTPLVLSPDRVPIVTDAEQAAGMPELAVLSAMAHGADPGHHQVLEALLGALASLDAPRGTLYARYPATVRRRGRILSRLLARRAA